MKLSHFIVPILCLMTSCVEKIALDTEEELPIAVYCILQEKDVQTLDLFYAKGKSQDEYIPIDKAKVVLYCDDKKVAEFKKAAGLTWAADYKPECSNRYSLEITLPDKKKPITAKTRMPADVEMDCLAKRRWYNDYNYIFYSYEIRCFNRNPLAFDVSGTAYTGEHYMWIFSKNGTEVATTHPYADRFNVSQNRIDNFKCFSKDNKSKWVSDEKDIFGWIPSYCRNIPVFNQFVRIAAPEEFTNGLTDNETTRLPYYSPISFIMITDYDHREDEGPLKYLGNHYDIFFLSKEYDEYMKELYTKAVLNKDNFLSVFDTKNLYTNFTGAVGVFGAMIKRTDKQAHRGYKNDFVDPDYPYAQ